MDGDYVALRPGTWVCESCHAPFSEKPEVCPACGGIIFALLGVDLAFYTCEPCISLPSPGRFDFFPIDESSCTAWPRELQTLAKQTIKSWWKTPGTSPEVNT